MASEEKGDLPEIYVALVIRWIVHGNSCDLAGITDGY